MPNGFFIILRLVRLGRLRRRLQFDSQLRMRARISIAEQLPRSSQKRKVIVIFFKSGVINAGTSLKVHVSS
jgi:hypothetical protein